MKLFNLKGALLAAALIVGNVANADISPVRATAGLLGGLVSGAATATLSYGIYEFIISPFSLWSEMSDLSRISSLVVFLTSLGLTTYSTNAVNYVCGIKENKKEKEFVNVADAIGTGIAMGAINHEIHRPRLQPGADFIFPLLGCGILKYLANKFERPTTKPQADARTV